MLLFFAQFPPLHWKISKSALELGRLERSRCPTVSVSNSRVFNFNTYTCIFRQLADAGRLAGRTGRRVWGPMPGVRFHIGRDVTALAHASSRRVAAVLSLGGFRATTVRPGHQCFRVCRPSPFPGGPVRPLVPSDDNAKNRSGRFFRAIRKCAAGAPFPWSFRAPRGAVTVKNRVAPTPSGVPVPR